MAENTVQLNLIARDQASQVIRGVMGQLQGMMGQLTMLAGIGGAGMGLGALIKQGIDFNKTMEDSKGGIAGVLLMTREYVNAAGKVVDGQNAMNAAFAEASKIQEKLKVDALGTAASYTELVGAFQTALAPAAAAGVTNLDDVREITVMATQAMAALNIPTAQAAQELRGLFAGDAGPDNRLNQILRVTKAEIAACGGDAEKLTKLFKDRLGPAASAAAMQTGTLTVRLSNLGDILDQTMGNATAGLFKEISSLISEMSAGIEANKGIWEDFGETVSTAFTIVKATVMDTIGAFTDGLKQNGATWRDVFLTMATVFLGFLEVVGYGVKYIADSFAHPLDKIKGLWVTLVGGIAALLGELFRWISEKFPIIGEFLGLDKAAKSVDDFVINLTSSSGAFGRFESRMGEIFGPRLLDKTRTFLDKLGQEVKKTVDGLDSRPKGGPDDTGAGVIDMKKFLAAAKAQGRTYATLVTAGFKDAFKGGEAAVEEFISVFDVALTRNNAKLGVSVGIAAAFASIPGAAESAASAVTNVWRSMAQAFDDLFFSVISGKLDSLSDVFQGFASNLQGIFSRLVTNMVERWVAGQQTFAEGLKSIQDSMRDSTGGVSAGGVLMGAAAGYGIGGSVGQGTQANQIGGAIGGAIGTIILPVIGTILGAIVGGLIGELFNKNTLQHLVGSLGSMVGAQASYQQPIYETIGLGGDKGWKGGWFEDPDRPWGQGPRQPIGWETRDYKESPQTALELAGKRVFDGIEASLSDLFKLGGGEGARGFLDIYRTSLKESLSGANFNINAGSNEDIEKRAEWLLTTMLPRIGLSAAFGQTGYLPPGYQDKGGVGNFSYGMPGMDPKTGQWMEKKLFSESSAMFKFLVGTGDGKGGFIGGLGFSVEKFAELASRISTDDPKKLLEYITGIVGVVVGLRDLGAEMGKTFEELKTGWAEDAAAGPAAAFAKTATALAGQFNDLSLYSGDEQLKKAQEAQAASDQFWQSVTTYLQQLDALAQKLSSGLQGMREKMRSFLNPLSESGAMAANQAVIDGTWGKLLKAMTPAEIESATNEAAAAIEALFNVMAERVTRGTALLARINGLIGKLGSLSADVAFTQLEQSNPLKAWGQEMIRIQGKITAASRLSGLEQIAAMEDVGASAEEMYQNLSGFLNDIANTARSIKASIGSQIWELGVGEMDPTGQATAITDRIKDLQRQLDIATSPAEIAAITSEIQSLTGRYVGQFGKDDPNRAAAIAWATQQLKDTGRLADEALTRLRDAGEAFGKELEKMLRGSTVTITTNVDLASKAILQLSNTLGGLDEEMKKAINRLGTAALDALAPLRLAMEGASAIFTGATGAAATSLTGETGFTASVDRSAASADRFTAALDRAAAKLDSLGGGAGTAPTTASTVVQQAPGARVSSREVIPMVRRFAGQLTPRVA